MNTTFQLKLQSGLSMKNIYINVKVNIKKIEVLKTKYYGNAMYLDGCFMLSEKNQDYYHEECIKLIPNNAKNINHRWR